MSFLNLSGRRLWYEIQGRGKHLLFLHPNAMSSELFRPLLPLYTDRFTVVLVDLLGHGRSDRLPAFPENFWAAGAEQIKVLIESLHLSDLCLLGVDGGAVTALHTALRCPGQVSAVIADGLAGLESRQKGDDFRLQRAAQKLSSQGQQLWQRMHGPDWEQVLDADTEMFLCHLAAGGRFFAPGQLEKLVCPLLFTAVRGDEVAPQAEEAVIQLAQGLPQARSYIFGSGRHPALLSNPQEFAEVAAAFAAM